VAQQTTEEAGSEIALYPQGLLVMTHEEHVYDETTPSTYRPLAPVYPQAVSELVYPESSLIVVAGPPGVGKTTLIERVIPEGVLILCPDEIRIRQQAEAGVVEYDPSFWAPVFKELLARVQTELEAGRTVAVHVTGLTYRQQTQLTSLSEKYNREAHIIFLDGTRALCDQGLAGRDRKIAEADMDEYFVNWQEFRYRLLGEDDSEETYENYDPNNRQARAYARECAHGMLMMSARGYTSVTVLDRAAVNHLQRISFT
jgi:predicted kinase